MSGTEGSPTDQFETASLASSEASSIYARANAMPSRALNARRLRMAAENDVQFLANRLAKLKLEEYKAHKEIERTRKKTNEITTNRTRMEGTLQAKRAMQEQVDYNRRKEAALIALNKEKRAKAIWISKQKLLLDKKEGVSSLRKQKEINACRIHILREEERERHIKQRESIRNMHALSKLRREREAEAKTEKVRELFEARIAREEAEREKKERLAAQLVTQEAQLIYRLKRMHVEKQAAVRDLAEAVDTVRNPASAAVSPATTLA